ncbi:S-adenosylmethionine decarboxylase [Dendrothele bispora CBS 962.96]|uniref:S-adenosylmethionine decarboxylase n=1 Tax=Dendrothele bispora (strain CBS 962.96) TaxID=1314807 RepID=A0A4S8M015_DENBC|nr:S-adenosylmethionine decarboxylase [Dendrothele bispora CBS 962.96]
MSSVYRCFYSRKSFMFPERQLGPHRDWSQEVRFLDSIFRNGAAYSVGKVNGDHWLLYLTNAASEFEPLIKQPTLRDPYPDYTIEILMTDLSPDAREPFSTAPALDKTASDHAQNLSASLGITDIFPEHLTTLDAYSFTPCGYSSNALIKWGEDPSFVPPSPNGNGHCINGTLRTGEGYYTIHVTPEEGWSYASFECNIPLPAVRPASESTSIPDLKTLVQRVVSIFQPGRLSLTLFISSEDEEDSSGGSRVDAAQKAFMDALSVQAMKGVEAGEDKVVAKRAYKRTDKINYEFGGYDLAFASFELFSSVLK